MIITCPCSEKKFEVNEKLIPDKGRLLKCGSCDQTWFFNKNIDEQTKPLIDKPTKQKKILYKDENVAQRGSNKESAPKNKRPVQSQNIDKKALVKYQKKTSFTFGKFLSYLIVLIISFIALIIFLDTFKYPLSNFFPNLELFLYNLFEILKDILSFVKDLI